MLWYLVICAMMLYPYAIARAGTLTGRSTKHIALFTACTILWFFMAFRGIRVGVDTKHYAYVFSQFRNIPFSRVFIAGFPVVWLRIALTTLVFSPKIRSATKEPVSAWRVLGYFLEKSLSILP